MDLAFTPQVNEFRGHSSVQLVLSAIRRHEPADLCRRILDLDETAAYAAAPFSPSRADFVRIWRSCPRDLRLPETEEEILALCPPEMEPERFCLCLITLLEKAKAGIAGETGTRVHQ